MSKRKTSELTDKALELQCKGYPVWQIANILNVTEAQVVKMLRLG